MAGLFDRLKTDAADEWWAFIAHDFVRSMGEGILAPDAFRHYLTQDYLFLIQFARAYALAAYKASTLAELRHAGRAMNAILDEMKLHERLCGRWGLDGASMEHVREARATVAYTRLVLDAGMRGDLLDLQVALAPCVIGYGEIGATLATTSVGLAADNPYREWIAEYAGEPYQTLANEAKAELDRLAEIYLTEARYPRLLSLFRQATRMEADFWQMGLTLSD